MRYVYRTVFISNPMRPWLPAIKVKCIVDTRALMLSITPAVARKLQILEIEKRRVLLGDGVLYMVPYVGPVKIEFNGQAWYGCVFVIRNMPRLGAVHESETDFKFIKTILH